jgi:hypothetical protein
MLAADLTAVINPRHSMEPGHATEIVARVSNVSADATAFIPVLRITFPEEFTVVSPVRSDGWRCSVAPGTVRCYALRIEPQRDNLFRFDLLTPATHRGGILPITASVTSATPDGVVSNNRTAASLIITRVYHVTSDADSGEGSFRAAIEDANRDCTGDPPCKVVFDFPATVELLSPLPPVIAANTLIGANEIDLEINGSRLREGNGLVLRQRGVETLSIQHLIINGFPENGISIEPVDRNIRVYDIRGNRIGANGLRGIAITDPAAHSVIALNQISGNGRSGVALWAAGNTYLFANRIGVKADSDEPLPNGAAGVYISAGTRETLVQGNLIAFHPDFGVGIEPGARNVGITGRVTQNGDLDVDWGLDGPTPNDVDDSDGIPNHPEVHSAVYDAAEGVTRISGEYRGTHRTGLFILYLYASDRVNRFGVAHLDRLIHREFTFLGEGVTRFEVTIPRDLRGQYVSAARAATLSPELPDTDSSELSRAVRVE